MYSLNNNKYGPIRGTKRVTGKCLEGCIKNEKFESVQCAERKIWRSEFSYRQVGHREALKAAENPPAGRIPEGPETLWPAFQRELKSLCFTAAIRHHHTTLL